MPIGKKRKFGDNEVRLEVPVPDFIPYACHYNKETLLTKNGELLQTIKITGFTFETIGAVKVGLRETVRKAISENIKSNNFALWFHTIRRHTDLDPGGNYDNNFASFLNKSWKARHRLNDQYMNELYITVIYEGQTNNIKNPKNFLRSLYPNAQKEHHSQYLAKHINTLTETTDNILRVLENFGAKKLTITTHNNIPYSEPLQFLNKITNLEDTPIPTPITGIDEYLAQHKVAFGYNAIEVIGKKGKHFGTILTIKEYHEISNKALDKLLQLNQQLVITQSIDFVNEDEAIETFKEQKYIFDISGSNELAEKSGLKETLETKDQGTMHFGEHQINILIIADELNELEENASQVAEVLAPYGITTIREDLRMEQCFWSQLPGNFPFLCRQSYINTKQVAGYASLHNFPAGKRNNNHWGDAVSVFHTQYGTPYFFNFHYEDNGHTLIVGPYGSGKTVLMNFLVSESRKFRNRLFFLDQNRASKVFIKALGGEYGILSLDTPSEAPFNPLGHPDTDENRRFLASWLTLTLSNTSPAPLTDQDLQMVEKSIQFIYTLPDKQRRIETLARFFMQNNAYHLSEALAPWYGEGKYASLFDNEKGIFSEKQYMYGFGMSQILANPETLTPTLSFIFHQIELSLDGSPMMIVLDEAWKLIDNEIFAPQLESWLNRMRENNAMVIFATESIDDPANSKLTNSITKNVATEIYLPNKNPSAAYQSIFGLTDHEFKLLQSINAKQRQFLFRHGADTIIAKLDLSGMEELAVLSGSDETVATMEQTITETGPEPDEWLPLFYQRTQNL